MLLYMRLQLEIANATGSFPLSGVGDLWREPFAFHRAFVAIKLTWVFFMWLNYISASGFGNNNNMPQEDSQNKMARSRYH